MNTERLDKFLDEMPLRGIPGCDLAVTRDGEEVYRRMVGYANLEEKRPIDRNTLYMIFSATKVMTCTAGMRLVEEGRLNLSDPVSDYLPSFGDLTVQQPDGSVVPAKEPMRILHLFTMTGGLDYSIHHSPAITEAIHQPNANTVSVCSAMAKKPLGFEPGTHYRYSLCHDVLGAVIEVVTGMPFSQYLDELIFKPLGMKDTTMHPLPEQSARLAQFYQYNNADGSIRAVPNVNDYHLFPNYDSGGAGAVTTVDDYTKFITALACDGTSPDGYRLLNPETIAEMEVNRLCPDALKDFVSHRLYGYGWGLCGRVHIDPVRSLSLSSVGEFGWDGAYGAFSMVDRKTRTALYFGMQVGSCEYAYNVLHPLLRNLVFEALDGKEF